MNINYLNGLLMYKCEFPGCKFKTKYRSYVNFHHIIPQENEDTSNKNNNLICVCPNCHTCIYIPESSSGIHTINGEDSIILKRWLFSTNGKVLEYIDKYNNLQYYFVNGE